MYGARKGPFHGPFDRSNSSTSVHKIVTAVHCNTVCSVPSCVGVVIDDNHVLIRLSSFFIFCASDCLRSFIIGRIQAVFCRVLGQWFSTSAWAAARRWTARGSLVGREDVPKQKNRKLVNNTVTITRRPFLVKSQKVSDEQKRRQLGVLCTSTYSLGSCSILLSTRTYSKKTLNGFTQIPRPVPTWIGARPPPEPPTVTPMLFRPNGWSQRFLHLRIRLITIANSSSLSAPESLGST